MPIDGANFDRGGQNKPPFNNGVPESAKSQFYDTIHFKYRSFVTTDEAIAYLPLAQRNPSIDVIINSTGTLNANTGVITGGTDVTYRFNQDGTTLNQFLDYTKLANQPTIPAPLQTSTDGTVVINGVGADGKTKLDSNWNAQITNWQTIEDVDGAVVTQGKLNQLIPAVYSNSGNVPDNNTIGLGDSIMYGLGVTTSWMNVIATHFNVTLDNLAVSGSTGRGQYKQFSLNAPQVQTKPLILAMSFNDPRTCPLADINKAYASALCSMRAVLAQQFVSSMTFPFTGDGSGGSSSVDPNYTFSASYPGGPATSEAFLQDWASRTYYYRHNSSIINANMYYTTSSVAGQTITASITGTDIAIGIWGCDGTTVLMSKIEVRVDGILKSSYDPNGQTWTNNGTSGGFTQMGIVNDAIIIHNLTNTTHSVEVRYIDSGKIAALDYIAILKTPTSASSLTTYIGDLYHMSNLPNIGYNYPGYIVTQAQLDNITTTRKADVLANFQNYPIMFVNTNNYYNPQDTTQVQSDGIHPTDAGDALIAQSFLENMVSTPVVVGYSFNNIEITDSSFDGTGMLGFANNLIVPYTNAYTKAQTDAAIAAAQNSVVEEEYTPIISTTNSNVNISSSSFTAHHYIRVGNTVTFFGEINIVPNAVGQTDFNFTLPISSNLTTSRQLSGSGIGIVSGAAFISAILYANNTGGDCRLSFYSSVNSNITFSIYGSYIII